MEKNKKMSIIKKNLMTFFFILHVNIHWQFFRNSNKTREMSLSSLHLTHDY